jgi:undecaprenyl-diphosphatase
VTVRDAVALGALEGPIELLPVSSSAHLAVVPWLLGSGYSRQPPEVRKATEAFAHLGAAAALALRDRRGLRSTPLSVLLPAQAPAVLCGPPLAAFIEGRLSRPGPVAAGLLAGSAALVVADRRAPTRGLEDATALDGLLLGLAQLLALWPGISRRAATSATARARGFDRTSAALLSQRVGLPVMAGSAVVMVARAPRTNARTLGATAAAAFASTLAAAHLTGRRAPGPAWPWAAYRAALAALVIRRLRDDGHR